MRYTDTHCFFWKSKLSQWARHSFTDIDGIRYSCAEQYMMAQKALLFNDSEKYNEVMGTSHPRRMQQLGREVRGYDQKIWDENKERIVYEASKYRLEQCSEFRKLLEKTKGLILVEASPIDRVWGIGLHEDDDLVLDECNWKGQNLLGIVLTRLRIEKFGS